MTSSTAPAAGRPVDPGTLPPRVADAAKIFTLSRTEVGRNPNAAVKGNQEQETKDRKPATPKGGLRGGGVVGQGPTVQAVQV